MLNTFIKREFLPTSQPKRKRWFTTFQCGRCCLYYTYRETPTQKELFEYCENCKLAVIAYSRFLTKAVEKHQNKFNYDKITADTYINCFTPVIIRCSIHGDFLQKPKDHINKTNGKLCCPECLKEFNVIHNKRSIESWKDELQLKFPHITMVQHGNSDSNREQCTLNCSYHGLFSSPLASIKNDVYLCQLCAQDQNSWGGRFRRTDVTGKVYFIHIPELNLWKLGVTSQTPEKRLKQLEFDYKILWCVEYSTLQKAYEEESRLFKMYKDYRRKLTEPKILGRCKGNSEILYCEIPVTAIHKSDLVSKEP